jgi:chromosome segregation ATPase
MKELDDEFKVVREFSSDGVVLKHVAYSASAHRLFAATSHGGIRMYKVPLTGEYTEFSAHDGSITMLRMSHDESCIHTVGEDGCVLIYRVQEIVNGAKRNPETGVSLKLKDEQTSVDEVLITRGDLDELHQRIGELQMQVKEVSLQAQYQLRLKAAEMGEKVKTNEDAYMLSLARERQRVSELERERDAAINHANEKIEQLMDAHANATAEAENEYGNKMFAEVERFDALKAASEMAQKDWELSKARLVEENKEQIHELKRQANITQLHLEGQVRMLEENNERIREEFECTRQIMDEEVDAEIEQLKVDYEARIQREHDVGLTLRGENGVTKNKYAIVKQYENARLEEIASLTAQAKQMSDTISALQTEAQELHETVDAHERSIDSKNALMSKLNDELTRSRRQIAVLTEEASKLKGQQGPMEERFAALQTEIDNMHGEILRYYDSNSALLRQIRDIKSQRDALQRDVMRTRKQNADTAAVVKRFQRDLHACAKNIQDGKMLKENVKDLYHKYTNDQVIVTDRNVDAESEERRQRDHLEKTVAALQRQLAGEVSTRRIEFHRIMRENQNLLNQIRESERSQCC